MFQQPHYFKRRTEWRIHLLLWDNKYLKMKTTNGRSFEETTNEIILSKNILSFFLVKLFVNLCTNTKLSKYLVNPERVRYDWNSQWGLSSCFLCYYQWALFFNGEENWWGLVVKEGLSVLDVVQYSCFFGKMVLHVNETHSVLQ